VGFTGIFVNGFLSSMDWRVYLVCFSTFGGFVSHASVSGCLVCCQGVFICIHHDILEVTEFLLTIQYMVALYTSLQLKSCFDHRRKMSQCAQPSWRGTLNGLV
jgi:hypothetical protein